MKTQNSLSLLECGREMHSRRSPPRDRRMIPSSVHSQTIVQQASLSTDQRKGVLIVPEHLYESSPRGARTVTIEDLQGGLRMAQPPPL